MLPNCDDLFLRYFDRWYDDSDRKRRGFAATRPDLLQTGELTGLSEEQVSPLSREALNEVRRRIGIMLEAAQGDWPGYLEVRGEVDTKWIASFDEYYVPEQVQAVIDRSDPKDFSNDYVVICCEFGAVLGHVLRSLQPRLIWIFEWPYWESALLDPNTGHVVPVFHWAVKKMSSYGVDDRFAEKVVACLSFLNRDIET